MKEMKRSNDTETENYRARMWLVYGSWIFGVNNERNECISGKSWSDSDSLNDTHLKVKTQSQQQSELKGELCVNYIS